MATLALASYLMLGGLSERGFGQIQVESLNTPTTYAIESGQPHPDFILPNIEDGQPIQLSDYRGQKVLLVHFASW